MAAGEFDLIARIRARVAAREDVVLGIGDDAALLRPAPGALLVACVDTLNAGVHFPPSASPFDIGWKALAVNLSDLAAMGAEPAWCLLSLSLPEADTAWVDAFLDGLLELAGRHGVALVGGDTTRGPLSVSLSAFGFVPERLALRRAGAGAGEDIWITGTLGDAAAGLSIALGKVPPAHDPCAKQDADAFLLQRLHRPEPRIAAGLALRGLATACIDVSDGLLADLGHVLSAAGLGARIEIDALPSSPALAARLEKEARGRLQCAGGDDYELCFTAPVARRAEVEAALSAVALPVARIGGVEAEAGIRCVDRAGRAIRFDGLGYDHFHSPSA